jgi:hypothetical protein
MRAVEIHLPPERGEAEAKNELEPAIVDDDTALGDATRFEDKGKPG